MENWTWGDRKGNVLSFKNFHKFLQLVWFTSLVLDLEWKCNSTCVPWFCFVEFLGIFPIITATHHKDFPLAVMCPLLLFSIRLTEIWREQWEQLLLFNSEPTGEIAPTHHPTTWDCCKRWHNKPLSLVKPVSHSWISPTMELMPLQKMCGQIFYLSIIFSC